MEPVGPVRDHTRPAKPDIDDTAVLGIARHGNVPDQKGSDTSVTILQQKGSMTIIRQGSTMNLSKYRTEDAHRRLSVLAVMLVLNLISMVAAPNVAVVDERYLGRFGVQGKA